jgi:hypothetical protein
VLVDRHLAAARHRGSVSTDGAIRLRLGSVTAHDDSEPARRQLAPGDDPARLLPTQFRALVDGRHDAGELKQVAFGFVRLNGVDDFLASQGADGLHRHLAEVTEVIDRNAAKLDVCWLETQGDANAVRWVLTAGAPTATERDGERLLRVLRRIADDSPVPLQMGANLGVVFVGDMGIEMAHGIA